jgi:hypothetical protein
MISTEDVLFSLNRMSEMQLLRSRCHNLKHIVTCSRDDRPGLDRDLV